MTTPETEPTPPPREHVIPSDLRSAKKLEQTILSAVRDAGFSEDHTFAIKLALEEALTNAIKHGNGNDVGKKVHVRFAVDNRKAVIFVRDEGSGFDPGRVPDPTTDENILRPCGRGIMLMRAYMSEVSYNEAGNELRMVKVNEP